MDAAEDRPGAAYTIKNVTSAIKPAERIFTKKHPSARVSELIFLYNQLFAILTTFAQVVSHRGPSLTRRRGHAHETKQRGEHEKRA
jgi:hypothetical protein